MRVTKCTNRSFACILLANDYEAPTCPSVVTEYPSTLRCIIHGGCHGSVRWVMVLGVRVLPLLSYRRGQSTRATSSQIRDLLSDDKRQWQRWIVRVNYLLWHSFNYVLNIKQSSYFITSFYGRFKRLQVKVSCNDTNIYYLN